MPSCIGGSIWQRNDQHNSRNTQHAALWYNHNQQAFPPMLTRLIYERMYTYNYRLFDRYRRQVASFAVLSDNNPDWKPGKYESQLWGCNLTFTFPVAKLTDYKGQWAMLEASNNPFAIVVMAHLKTQETQHDSEERRFWKFYIIRHLYERGYEREDIINLFHFIDWIMWLPPAAEQELWQEMEQLEGEKKMPYITSVERIGIQKGRKEGTVLLLLRVLTHRFGQIPDAIQMQLQTLPMEQIEQLADLALTRNSLTEFMNELPNAVAA